MGGGVLHRLSYSRRCNVSAIRVVPWLCVVICLRSASPCMLIEGMMSSLITCFPAGLRSHYRGCKHHRTIQVFKRCLLDAAGVQNRAMQENRGKHDRKCTRHTGSPSVKTLLWKGRFFCRTRLSFYPSRSSPGLYTNLRSSTRPHRPISARGR